jgi:HlyD family secretion protein
MDMTVKRFAADARRRPVLLGLGVAGLLMAVAIVSSTWRSEASLPGSPPGLHLSDPKVHVVEPRPATKFVRLVGVIDARSVAHVAAPFAAKVLKKHFEYGQQVKADEVLLTLDSGAATIAKHEAESVVIQAQQKLADLREWQQSADVARALRNVQNSTQQLQKLKQQEASAQELFKLGIVARQEVDDLALQRATAEHTLASAQEELDSVKKKGNSQAVRIAELELANARFKLQQANEKLAAATVRAPAAGVVMPPPETSNGNTQESREIAVGTKVTEGQLLMTIGTTDGLRVSAKAAEADVAALAVGQAVRVTSPALPEQVLQGRIASIAGQAGKENEGGMPRFGLLVDITSTDATLSSRIKLGMSADLEVIVLQKPDAIVIPPSAISSDGAEHSVRRRDAQTGEVQSVKVALGARLPDGIEITSGLTAGDQIVLQ